MVYFWSFEAWVCRFLFQTKTTAAVTWPARTDYCKFDVIRAETISQRKLWQYWQICKYAEHALAPAFQTWGFAAFLCHAWRWSLGSGSSDQTRPLKTPFFQVGNSWRLKVWEKPNFEGLSMEVADNMPALHERWHSRDIHSCKVFEGAWIFYEHPNYRGRQYLLERGEYRRYSEWGGVQPTVGSIRRVKEQ